MEAGEPKGWTRKKTERVGKTDLKNLCIFLDVPKYPVLEVESVGEFPFQEISRVVSIEGSEKGDQGAWGGFQNRSLPSSGCVRSHGAGRGGSALLAWESAREE